VAETIMSIQRSNNTNRNRNHDLVAQCLNKLKHLVSRIPTTLRMSACRKLYNDLRFSVHTDIIIIIIITIIIIIITEKYVSYSHDICVRSFAQILASVLAFRRFTEFKSFAVKSTCVTLKQVYIFILGNSSL